MNAIVRSSILAANALWTISMMKLQPLASIAVFVVLIGMAYPSHAQSPANDVAAQVRSQGYKCIQPITTTRDMRMSKPDSAVWILKCRNTAYRVRLVPDMAARVTRLRSH
jgi:hypothetical protein